MALGLTLTEESNYVLARGSNWQQSVGRCCGGHGGRKVNWLMVSHHWGWRRRMGWVLVSHDWERRGKVDWLLDGNRNIRSLMVMDQTSRDSVSSGR
jgi:hypothetical protein